MLRPNADSAPDSSSEAASLPVSPFTAENSNPTEQNRNETGHNATSSAGGHSSNTALSLRATGKSASQEPNDALEVADEAATRDFYSQLVTLLTQDSSPPPKKVSRNGLLPALRRRWFPALLLSALAFVALSSLLRPRQSTYQATVTLLLPPEIKAAAQDPLTPPEASYDTETEMAIIESEGIVQSAMSQVPPALRLSGWGSKDASVVPVDATSNGGSDSLINIGVSSLNPAASFKLSEEMVRAYTGYTRKRYEQNREENLQITKRRVVESNRLLEAARDQLRNFKERSGVFDVSREQGGGSGSIAELENALAQAKAETVEGSESQSLMEDSRLSSLRQQALEAQNRYQIVLRDFLPTSERARAAEREWGQAQRLVQLRSNEVVTASSRRRSVALAANARRRAQLEASLRTARNRAAALPAIEQTLNRLGERVQLLETAYRGASERYNQLNLARDTVAPTARVLRSPSVSSSRRIQWIRALGVALLASLGLGLMSAWLLNRLDRTVRTIADPSQFFDVPILGAMPATGGRSTIYLSHLAPKKGRGAVQTATIEACYSAQLNLLAAAKTFDCQSILLTSAVPREGKSQCASNLATAIAYGGQSVLLIDADFLHPSQHEIMKMSLEPGYAQVLQGTATLTEAVRATHVTNLHLLCAGKNALKNPEDLVVLLSGAAHLENLRQLKQLYDVILIDAPPTMSMQDAQLLSHLADGIVLVTAQNTPQDEVYRAGSMLRLAGSVLLGVIVNSVNRNEMSEWTLDFAPEMPFSNYAHSLRGRSR